METVLITGGSTGIGYEMAKCFCARQDQVIIVARHEQVLLDAAKSLKDQFNKEVKTYAIDLTQEDAPNRLLKMIEDDHLSVSILVNNAGFGITGKSMDIDVTDDQRLIKLNDIALVNMCKVFMPMLIKNQGKILNVSSIGAFMPGPYISTYYASKAFVYSYSRALRYEMKSQGVNVSVLCPGPVKTRFFEKANAKTPTWSLSPEKVANVAVKQLMKNKEVIIPGIINKIARIAPKKIAMKYTAELKK